MSLQEQVQALMAQLQALQNQLSTQTPLSGEALGPRRFGLSAGIDPTYRGPASLEAVSESSVSAAQVALQGLTCD